MTLLSVSGQVAAEAAADLTLENVNVEWEARDGFSETQNRKDNKPLTFNSKTLIADWICSRNRGSIVRLLAQEFLGAAESDPLHKKFSAAVKLSIPVVH